MQGANGTRGFSMADVELLARERTHSGYFALDRLMLRHRKFSSEMTGALAREVFLAGDAVVVLPYDPARDMVVLIEQFRPGPYAHNLDHPDETPDGPWLVETVAGRIEAGESPEDVARREAEEEAGLALGALYPIGRFYQSPGALSECIHYFCALADAPASGGLHGADHEGEDIRVLATPRTEAEAALAGGRILNVATAYPILWLARNYRTLAR